MNKHTLGQWIIALRPWSIPASAMPVIVTLSFLFWKGTEINWLNGILALIGMILFHLSGNTWSDYYDYKQNVDTEETYGAKTLTTKMFKPEEIKKLSIILLVAASIIGITLLILTGLPLLWIGLTGLACTILYPYLKFNALGDIDILLTFALLPTIGTSYATTGTIDWSVIVITLPIGLITDGILHSNNIRDIKTDKRANIKTMAMVLGTKTAAKLYLFEITFPFILVSICSIIGTLPLHTNIVLIALPTAIACAKTITNTTGNNNQPIADIDARTAQLQLQFSALLSIALILARFI